MIVRDENVEKCKGNQESIGKDTLELMSKGDRGKFHGVISNDLDRYNTLAGEDTSENNRVTDEPCLRSVLKGKKVSHLYVIARHEAIYLINHYETRLLMSCLYNVLKSYQQ
jgi:hypothetical protein